MGDNAPLSHVSVLFQAVHGKQCRHPFTNRLLPIIADPLVDTQLGTGEGHVHARLPPTRVTLVFVLHRCCQGYSGSRPHRLPAVTETLASVSPCDWR